MRQERRARREGVKEVSVEPFVILEIEGIQEVLKSSCEEEREV